MLNDDHRGTAALLDLVDELNGLLAGGRVEVGQRLVEKQHLHLVHHYARQAHALLLSAAKLVRGVAQVVFHAHQRGHAVHRLAHARLRRAVVLQREGDVLAHGQADELPVRVLKHGAHVPGQLKHARLGRIHAVHGEAAGDRAGIAGGDQAVEAAAQRALAAARRAGDEHPLARVDVQVDMAQGGPLLRPVLKGKVPEGDDGGLQRRHLKY